MLATGHWHVDGVWNHGFELFDLHSWIIKVKTALNSYSICFLDRPYLFSTDITVAVDEKRTIT